MKWQELLDSCSAKLLKRYPANKKEQWNNNEINVIKDLSQETIVNDAITKWLSELHDKKEEKSVEKSMKFKEEGNGAFKLKKYEKSIELYTKSAQYAPEDSAEFPIAIGNRSAAFHQMGLYEEAIKDAKQALALGYPNDTYKLYLRLARCYLSLQKRAESENYVELTRKAIEDSKTLSDVQKTQQLKCLNELKLQVSKLINLGDTNDLSSTTEAVEFAYGSNPNFPDASAALTIRKSEQKGRYVVATKPIKKGQVLFIERPFALVSVDSSVCAECVSLVDMQSFPCKGCTNTIYCSLECCDSAKSIHRQWECVGSQMNIWKEIGLAHLAIRVLLAGMKAEQGYFERIQKLVTNLEKHTIEDLICYGITAYMMATYLKSYTTFFETVDLNECYAEKLKNDSVFATKENMPSDKTQAVSYLSGLLLRHTLQLVCNAHAITDLRCVNAICNNVTDEKQDRLAAAIYPSASIMNHSCEPSIVNSFMKSKLIVKACKDIPKGAEVFHCYGPNYRQMPRSTRQEMLSYQYKFSCYCDACTDPKYDNFIENFKSFKCTSCKSGTLHDVNGQNKCSNCSREIQIDEQVMLDLKKADILHESALDSAEAGDDDKALMKLKECLELRKKHLYKYHEDIANTLDFIGKIYAMSGKFYESISYLEDSVDMIKARYGEDSVQYANELNKLTDIGLKYFENYRDKSVSKVFRKTLKSMMRYAEDAQEILDLHYGSWNNNCVELVTKREIFESYIKAFQIVQ